MHRIIEIKIPMTLEINVIKSWCIKFMQAFIGPKENRCLAEFSSTRLWT